MQHGMRGVSDDHAIGYYPNLANKSNEVRPEGADRRARHVRSWGGIPTS